MDLRLQVDHPDELRQARMLWEHCFPEDSQAFLNWYFSSMYQPDRVLGAYEGNTLVSDLHMLPYHLSIQGKSISASSLSGVGTYTEYRHRGYAKALITASFALMRDRKQIVSFLMPSLKGFYEPLGYETCYDMITCTQTTGSTGNHAENTLPDVHAMELLHVYEKAVEGCSGYVIRDRQAMVYRLEDHASDGGLLVRAWDGEKCCAYALVHETDDEWIVDEWAAASLEQHAFMAALNPRCGGKISWSFPVWMQKKIPIYNTMCTKTQGIMLRIIDFPAFYSIMDHAALEPIVLMVNDPLCEWNHATWKLGGGESAMQQTYEQPDAMADIGTWTTLLTGAKTISSAVSEGKLLIMVKKAEGILTDWLKQVPMIMMEKY